MPQERRHGLFRFCHGPYCRGRQNISGPIEFRDYLLGIVCCFPPQTRGRYFANANNGFFLLRHFHHMALPILAMTLTPTLPATSKDFSPMSQHPIYHFTEEDAHRMIERFR